MLRIFLLLYCSLVAIGVVAFLMAPEATPTTPAIAESDRVESASDSRVNHAELWRGARVRASGWDRFHSHHPLYLIDGERSPTAQEKWATRVEQPYPWVDVLFPEPLDVDEVVLYHGGWREDPSYTHDRYIIQCFRGDEMVDEVGVLGNVESIVRHPVSCDGVDRIWVWFDCTGPVNVVRLYEIEAWGAP